MTGSSAAALVPAEFPVRLLARGLDVLVLAAVDVGLGRLMGYGFDWLLVGSAVVYFYFSLLDALAGATLGKLVLGLRVLGPDGGRPTLRQSLRREAFTLVGSIPFIGPILALAAWVVIARTIRESPSRRGKHDELAGGTRVVQLQAG
ncbi:RDD family protein [Nannocystis pusilla]|uniref:RDD family protein n=1 Tax=Nannocystis pusilla TaxID=889268 RepID=A0ABS7U2E4_9BACT|nr:RDD family protein [Nannocystis pusilla]MBZ5714635.1 RDD family protein [Nannocystis pusilla]